MERIIGRMQWRSLLKEFFEAKNLYTQSIRYKREDFEYYSQGIMMGITLSVDALFGYDESHRFFKKMAQVEREGDCVRLYLEQNAMRPEFV